MRRLLRAAVVILLIAGAAVAAGARPGLAATPGTDPVLLIHGFSGPQGNGSSATVPDGCMAPSGFGSLWASLHNFGWTGPITSIGYYAGDYQGTAVWDCDVNLDSHAPGSVHQSACDSASQFWVPADEGTNNQDDRNIACQIAWYIFNTFTVHGQDVNVVAHSMGGLIIRYALMMVNADAPGYPPYLYVPNVVTLDTPHGAITTGGADLCGGCVQGYNMQQGSNSADSFINTLMSEAYAPIGSPAVPTAWTVMGDTHSVVLPDESMDMPPSYGSYPPVHKVLYLTVPGWPSLPWDVHGAFLTDESGAADAPAEICDNCAGTPNTAAANIEHPPNYTVLRMLAAYPAAPAVPVIDFPNDGAFKTEWNNVGGVNGPLGAATGSAVDISGGRWQPFAHGGIYYWATTGETHEVHGSIYAKYVSSGVGGPAGKLGYPLSDQTSVISPSSVVSYFAGESCDGGTPISNSSMNAGSAIFASSDTATAQEMQGCIFHTYELVGGADGLGLPVSDETSIGSGKVSYLSGTSCSLSGPGPDNSRSAIYWSPSTPAVEVQGCIYAQYLALGGPVASGLGFPTSNEYGTSTGRRSDFQNGYIQWSNGQAIACYGGYCPPPFKAYQVTGVDSSGLAVQSVPHVNHVQRWLPNGTTVDVICQTKYGDQVDGATQYGRPFTTWDQLSDGNWVYDWYLNTPVVQTDGYSAGMQICPGG